MYRGMPIKPTMQHWVPHMPFLNAAAGSPAAAPFAAGAAAAAAVPAAVHVRLSLFPGAERNYRDAHFIASHMPFGSAVARSPASAPFAAGAAAVAAASGLVGLSAGSVRRSECSSTEAAAHAMSCRLCAPGAPQGSWLHPMGIGAR